MKAPSGNIFGKIPGAESKDGEWWRMRQRIIEASQELQGKFRPDLQCTRRDPTLTHLSSDNRLWLQQVWAGRKAPEDFAPRSRAVLIMRDWSNPVLPKVLPQRHADKPSDPRMNGEQLRH